jgi:ABC-2 type transport system permease protein
MLKMLKTEWLKIRNYPAFWLVMATTALSYPGINLLFWYEYKEITKKELATGKMIKMLLGNPFAFPDTFHTTAFFSSIFVFIPAIVVMLLITNEYTYKTNRQNIIDGWSRNHFILGKFFDVALITLLVTLLYAVIAYIIGMFATESIVSSDIWKEAKYIPLFMLQTFSQLSIAFLIGFIVKKAFIALGVFVFYSIILENAAAGIARQKFHDLGRFLPLEISDRLIPVPAFIGRLDEKGYAEKIASINTHVVYTIILTALVWAVIYLVNKKRDL